MNFGIALQAIGMFAGTNIDDTLVLALFFAAAAGRRSAELHVVIGQYLGFIVILAASIAGALGAGFLPEWVLPYFGLIPLVLGLRAAFAAWRQRGAESIGRASGARRAGVDGASDATRASGDQELAGRGDDATLIGTHSRAAAPAPTVWAVALVTVANGGDNIGVYVPVFANASAGEVATYCAVFLILLAALLLLGRFFARRRAVTQAIARWGHVILPIVLIGIGLYILIRGGAFAVHP